MAEVILEGVSKIYPRKVKAVDGLSLHAQDGQLVVLVGPSGCGKSTTLRMIAGLETCDEGTITIGKRVVNALPPKDRDIAMVFQNYALYPHMTVYKNMAFGLELRAGGGWPLRVANRMFRPKKARKLAARRRLIPGLVRQAAQALEMDHLLDRYPRQLSGGERQRVALGRAIVRDPAVFLFDEPLSNLDAKLRVETRREIKRLHQSLQATMIYVTHDQTEALTLGDRIVVLDQGKVQQEGSPKDVYRFPVNRFVAGFLGSPAMNLVRGRLEQGEHCLRFFHHDAATPMVIPESALPAATFAKMHEFTGREVELGIRPEDIELRLSLDDESSQSHNDSTTQKQQTHTELNVQVSLIESLGDVDLVHLEIGAGNGGAATGVVQIGKEEKNSVKLKELHPSRNTNVMDRSPEANPHAVHQPGRALLTCKTRSGRGLRVGDRVLLGWDPTRLHCFDAATGENLTLPSGN